MVLSRMHNDEVIAKAVNKAVAAARAEIAAAAQSAVKAEMAAAAQAAVKAEMAVQAEVAAAAQAAAVAKAVAEEVPRMVAETVAQERRAVAVWYARMKQAQQAGLPFDEPPPGYANGAAGSGGTPG